MSLSGKRILITGGLGFIGSNLAIRLVREGARVSICDAMIYGPRAQRKHPHLGVVNWFVRLALDGRPIPIFGTGGILSDFLSVDDCVEALVHISKIRRRLAWEPTVELREGLSRTASSTGRDGRPISRN